MENRMVDLEGETVVFLKVRPGNVDRAVKDLRRNESVRMAQATLGPYDVIVRGSFRDDAALRAFVKEVEGKEYADGCEARPSFRQWSREKAIDAPLVGWTLIQARNPESTMKGLQNIAAVSRVYEMPGQFNLIASVQAKDPTALMDTLTKEVHKLEGVRRTETLMGFREPEER